MTQSFNQRESLFVLVKFSFNLHIYLVYSMMFSNKSIICILFVVFVGLLLFLCVFYHL